MHIIIVLFASFFYLVGANSPKKRFFFPDNIEHDTMLGSIGKRARHMHKNNNIYLEMQAKIHYKIRGQVYLVRINYNENSEVEYKTNTKLS